MQVERLAGFGYSVGWITYPPDSTSESARHKATARAVGRPPSGGVLSGRGAVDERTSSRWRPFIRPANAGASPIITSSIRMEKGNTFRLTAPSVTGRFSFFCSSAWIALRR